MKCILSFFKFMLWHSSQYLPYSAFFLNKYDIPFFHFSKGVLWYRVMSTKRMNFYNHHNSVSFKSHSISRLSDFAQCWLPCARLNPVARIPWAPSTAQILKVTLIEWLLKLTLLALHQVFTPNKYVFIRFIYWSRTSLNFHLQMFHAISTAAT